MRHLGHPVNVLTFYKSLLHSVASIGLVHIFCHRNHENAVGECEVIALELPVQVAYNTNGVAHVRVYKCMNLRVLWGATHT